MTNVNNIERIGLILVIASTACLSAYAQKPCKVPSGCPTYKPDGASLDLNQHLPVTLSQIVDPNQPNTTSPVSSDPNNPINTATSAALSLVNGQATSNGTGNTFSQPTGTVAAGADQVMVVFDTVQQYPPDPNNPGKYVAGTSSWTKTAGYVTVYLNAQTCGGPCYDPSDKQAYIAAIQHTIEHELYHGDGIGDLVGGVGNSVMSNFQGRNNSSGVNNPTNCDLVQATRQANIKKYGTPCPPK